MREKHPGIGAQPPGGKEWEAGYLVSGFGVPGFGAGSFSSVTRIRIVDVPTFFAEWVWAGVPHGLAGRDMGLIRLSASGDG